MPAVAITAVGMADESRETPQRAQACLADMSIRYARIPNGLAKIKQHAKLFADVEKKYGVPAPVLTAFWGLESDFGANFGNYKILSAIATLAYDCRRPDFFRTQLFDALRIIERGDQRVDSMIGDWAGEFGGMQFTASDYLKNARRLRRRRPPRPDPQRSRHHRLRRQLPGQPRLEARRALAAGGARAANLPWQEADVTITHPRSQWVAWGVKAAHGSLPPDDLPASLILPMGRHGPAFLAYPNFQAFLGWNSAYVYSTTVAYFATRLAGAPTVDHEGAKDGAGAEHRSRSWNCSGCSTNRATRRRRSRRQSRLRHPRRGQEGADQVRSAGGFLSDRRTDRAPARRAGRQRQEA